MAAQYRMRDDSRHSQQIRIEWRCDTPDDDDAGAPDQHDEGFWPDRNPKSAGYPGKGAKRFAKAQQAAQARMEGWNAGEWRYVGVRAHATLHVPVGGNSFAIYELTSPGIWGIESDCTDYIAEMFEEEKAELLSHLRIIADGLPNP